jgi:hypothetical protein
MLNDANWGGHFVWFTWPQHRAFIDTRIELYPTNAWEDYFAMSFPRDDWQSVMDAYQIDYLVLLNPDNADLIATVRGSDRWRTVYDEEPWVVFVRA